MTSLEKAIHLGYLFLTLNPPKKINTCTTFCCMYWYVSIYSEECFWPQYMYPKLSPFNGYFWCPLGKFSHLGLEQLFDAPFFRAMFWEVCFIQSSVRGWWFLEGNFHFFAPIIYNILVTNTWEFYTCYVAVCPFFHVILINNAVHIH